MNTESVRQFCMTLPHVTEQVQWGEDLVFKVGGKMFAVVNLGPMGNRISFKCSPETFAELTEREGIIPAPYMARAQWVALETYEALRSRELQEYLGQAYQLIFDRLSGKMKKQLQATEKNKGRARKVALG